jgi:CHAD domain-containing protein
MATKTETERKYEVPVDFTLPDLAGLPGVSTIGDPVEHHLDAVYFDTQGLRLAANRITVRRRTGGGESGWHIKRPAAGPDARTETQLPLTPAREDVPAAVDEAVRDVSAGEPLTPIAHVKTRRLERHLCDRDGRTLAVIADDLVSADAPGDPVIIQRWRELEVELVDGSPNVLDAVETALGEVGVSRSSADSKLARTLGDRYPHTEQPTHRADEPARAGEPLQRYARKQLAAIRTGLPGTRRADPDAIHDTRVAVRRLRSTLRTFRPLLDRDRSEPLRADLKWLGDLLGGVRDGQVMAKRLQSAIANEPAEVVLGPVSARVRSHLAAETTQAHERLTAGLDSPRYAALIERMERFADDQFSTHHRPKRLRRLARKSLRRADRRLDSADSAEPDSRAAALHEARKAYKQARYAAEVLRPIVGNPAKRLARRLADLQDVLGAHQDSVVTGQKLRTLALRAHGDGDNAFTYGMLLARQDEAARQQVRALPKAIRRATRPKVRRWLT